MAKFVFFTENLPADIPSPFAEMAWELILNAAESGHEILVLTSAHTHVEVSHPRVQILQPFRNWNWFEVLPILPILLQFNPDLVHLIQTETKNLSTWTHAYRLVLALCKTYLGCAPVLSVLDPHPKKFNRRSSFINAFELVTLPPGFQQTIEWRPTTQNRFQNLPMFVSATAPSRRRNSDQLELDDQRRELIPAGSEILILIPGNLDQQQTDGTFTSGLMRLRSQFAPGTRIVIAGGWGRLPLNKKFQLQKDLHAFGVEVTGPLSNADLMSWIEISTGLDLTSMHPESLWYFSGLQAALRLGRPILINKSHAPFLGYVDLPNVFLADDAGESVNGLVEFLKKASLPATHYELTPEDLRAHDSALLLDKPKNELNRLYASLLGGTNPQTKS